MCTCVYVYPCVLACLCFFPVRALLFYRTLPPPRLRRKTLQCQRAQPCPQLQVQIQPNPKPIVQTQQPHLPKLLKTQPCLTMLLHRKSLLMFILQNSDTLKEHLCTVVPILSPFQISVPRSQLIAIHSRYMLQNIFILLHQCLNHLNLVLGVYVQIGKICVHIPKVLKSV